MQDWPVGSLVRLRLPTVDDQPAIDRWSLPAHRSSWNTHAKRPRTIAEKLAAGPLVGDDGGTLLIIRLTDDQPVGDIVWRPAYYGPAGDVRSRAWRVGREMLDGTRGQGLGTEALTLLIEWLFTNTDVNRIDGYTDIENVASQRSVAKAGLRQEGILHGAVYRDGIHRDVIMYGLTRADWVARRDAAVRGMMQHAHE
jgi:RimJ/RimL family protein N-acetyltransferase